MAEKREPDASRRCSGREKRENSSWMRGKNVHGEVGWARQQVAQRGCKISVCGDFQSLTGKGPEQPD